MKKFKIEIILMGVLAMIFASCSDFFEPNNDTTLNGDRYIKEGSELYSGFLGIITKIQAIGDKAIYLTDMRESCWNLPKIHRQTFTASIIMMMI